MKIDKVPRIRTDKLRQPQIRNQEMKMGTINVLSWYRTTAANQTMNKLKIVVMDVTAIEELRWTGIYIVEMAKNKRLGLLL